MPTGRVGIYLSGYVCPHTNNRTMKIDWVILLTVMLALLTWEVLDRLFLGSALDSVIPANYEVAV